jgi:hypothetical protein
MLQPENGIEIKEFRGEASDAVLDRLGAVLAGIAGRNDYREALVELRLGRPFQ